MNERTGSASAVVCAALVSLAVAFAAVSSQSLWIDEANSATKAIAPTLKGFFLIMSSDRNSDLQMPLYMLLLWTWEKIAGSSEYALRGLNIPLFAVAIVFAVWRLRIPATQRILFLAFACSSPFMWAYLNEARPYILQFLAGTAIMIPLVNMAGTPMKPSSDSLACFALGIVALCASSLIGVVFSAFFAVSYLTLWIMRERLSMILRRKDVWTVAGGGSICIAALGAFYLWTLLLGAKASGVGATGLPSLAFCIYELFGFSGFGPARTDLRHAPMAALKPFFLSLLLYGAIFASFSLAGFSILRNTISSSITQKQFGWRSPSSSYLILAVFALLACLALLSIGVVGHFRIVGRHFMPVFPLILFALSYLGTMIWMSGKRKMQALVIAILLGSSFSAAALRFSDIHRKDDYRSASAVAKTSLEAGEPIWWAADPAGAAFYGISLWDSKSIPGRLAPSTGIPDANAFLVNNSAPDIFPLLPRPALIVLSKNDIYDRSGHLLSWARQNGYATFETYPAFQILRPK